MTPTIVSHERDQQTILERRLYRGMLLTRLFEDALIRWEHEGKISAQTFPSKGQEAIAIGCCLALERATRSFRRFAPAAR
jgi:TPP-dependent pyruvate/acetoin dehydrogenase alpha subunit